MSASDSYAYNFGFEDQTHEYMFNNRQFIYVNDSNNGSYPNGQVVFDLSPIANAGKYVDFQQSYITIPLVMQLKTSAGAWANSAENAWAVSLKNFPALINSISLEITNNTVVNLTNFSNHDIAFKVLTSFSASDEKNLTSQIGFAKDSVDSLTYHSVADPMGFGECNNKIKEALWAGGAWGTATGGMAVNKGRLERMCHTSFDPTNGSASVFVSQNNCLSSGKNLVVGAISTTEIFYVVNANIPCYLLHDIFRKLPLVKNVYARLIINTNTSAVASVACSAANTYGSVSTTSPNGVFPAMLSPQTAGDGFSNPGAGYSTAFTLSVNIGKSADGTQSGTYSSCRFNACMYEMNALYEEKYLSERSVQKVLYNDILCFQSNSPIQSGQNFSQVLTNGVSRPRYLLGVPMISSTANQVSGTPTYMSPMNSPFTSAGGGTVQPFANITAFNVLLSGNAIYQQNYNYKYEFFVNELRKSNSLNGGIAFALSSGLISQKEYEHGYGYIYVDLSRRLGESNDNLPKSIQVIGTNSSLMTIDIYWIVGYERELSISPSTGSLVI